MCSDYSISSISVDLSKTMALTRHFLSREEEIADCRCEVIQRTPPQNSQLLADSTKQKVTVILNSLVQRYQREGSAFLRNTQIWVCSVCGFAYVGDTPPELCPVCKVPAWKFDKIEGRRSA